MSCHRSHGGGRRPRCPALPRRAEIVVPDDERAAIVQDGDDVELCIAFPTHGDKYQGHKVAWLKEEGPSYDNTSRSVIEAAFLGHDTGRAAVGVRPVPGWDEPLRFIVVRVKPAVCASILGDGGERHIEKARAPPTQPFSDPHRPHDRLRKVSTRPRSRPTDPHRPHDCLRKVSTRPRSRPADPTTTSEK